MGIMAAITAALEIGKFILERGNINLKRKYSDPLAAAEKAYSDEIAKPYYSINTDNLARQMESLMLLTKAMIADGMKSE